MGTQRNTVETDADTEIGLRSAICIYLIAECREGATIGELARLSLSGRAPSEEVGRVSKAVSQLVEEGEVKLLGERVVPM